VRRIECLRRTLAEDVSSRDRIGVVLAGAVARQGSFVQHGA
jgi:hypothetical protein